jgi:hypothetical protein
LSEEKMTELQAVLLTMGAGLLAGLVAGGVLAALHADAGLIVVAFLAIFCIGIDAAVRVERRYDEHPDR